MDTPYGRVEQTLRRNSAPFSDGLSGLARSAFALTWSSVEETRKGCRQRRRPLGQQARLEIEVAAMKVAPAPGLAAFEGRNYRMAGRVEMLKSVGMLRVLTAPDMATGQTYAKLVPLDAKREAFLAAVCARRYLPHLTDMFTTLGHGWHVDVDRQTVPRKFASLDCVGRVTLR